jgi:predicted RNA-binding protein YlxR (DUF448 family)
MRSPRNEALNDPERSCILTRDRAPRAALVRLVLAPDGQVLPDVRARAPGRGAWIGVDAAALTTALANGKLRGALARAFRTGAITVPADLPALVEAALRRHALDRLGLEARAGAIITGAERIEAAARAGALHALYHAADAAADGVSRLAQAWRVGSDREGSGARGLVLPLARPILSMALGRENVVHIGVADRQAAARLGEALDRWLHFIGPNQESAPCETASQGASAPRWAPGPEAATNVQEESE